jgi:hypothetical protein
VLGAEQECVAWAIGLPATGLLATGLPAVLRLCSSPCEEGGSALLLCVVIVGSAARYNGVQ